MTIIEFFDKAPIENIASTLLCDPDKVIFIGDKKKKMEKSINIYNDIISKRGRCPEFAYKIVLKNDLMQIIDALESIVIENGECIFDLTGGEDLYLVAVGAIKERFQDRVQCHRFNIKSSTITDCDSDGVVCSVKPFDVSVEENILLHGGEIVGGSETSVQATYDWKYDDEFCRDIEVMWDICRHNPRQWNANMGTLGAIDEAFHMQDSLTVSFEKDKAGDALSHMGMKSSFILDTMRHLEEKGLIFSTEFGEHISFRYKNKQVKRCLTVSGQILELAMAVRLFNLKEEDGKRLYHDARVGVVIDWDGNDPDEKVRTVNEIDILAMKDSIPVFISCKNGNFGIDELYKLNTVAERFGSQYAKKVLIASELDKIGNKSEYIRARAEDMGIRLVEDVDTISDNELDRILKSLWRN